MKKNNRRNIDSLLRGQVFEGEASPSASIYRYAESISVIEKNTVVVSDLKAGSSTIFHGAFSQALGLHCCRENSIWEAEILSRMSEEQQEKKHLVELRFFNFLRHLPRAKRDNYYLASHLKMRDSSGAIVDVLHRMYYSREGDGDAVRFGICIYEPLVGSLPADSIAIDSLSGKWVELSSDSDCDILSARERQVLALIEKGLTSLEIASQLCISKNTVSRHRQEILAKLQVKNSTRACLRARQLHIL